jgi:hypothetical protein
MMKLMNCCSHALAFAAVLVTFALITYGLELLLERLEGRLGQVIRKPFKVLRNTSTVMLLIDCMAVICYSVLAALEELGLMVWPAIA